MPKYISLDACSRLHAKLNTYTGWVACEDPPNLLALSYKLPNIFAWQFDAVAARAEAVFHGTNTHTHARHVMLAKSKCCEGAGSNTNECPAPLLMPYAKLQVIPPILCQLLLFLLSSGQL